MKGQNPVPATPQLPNALQRLISITDFPTLEDIIIDAFTARMNSVEFRDEFTGSRKHETCQILAALVSLIQTDNKEVCHA